MKRGLLLVVPSVVALILASCDEDTPVSGGPDFDGGTLDVGRTDAPITVPPEAGNPVDAGTDAPADGSGTGNSGALNFDGLNDVVIVVPTIDGGPSETSFTVELWFKTTATLGTMFNVFGTGGGADRFLFTKAGKVCFYVYSPATIVCSAQATYNDGQWHHAAASVGLAGERVYVDGVLADSNTAITKSTFNGGNRIAIGLGPTEFNGAGVYFAGQIDEVRMWTVERHPLLFSSSSLGN